MNKELLRLKKIYRKTLPNEDDDIGKVFLNIFSVRYSLTDSDYQRKFSTCVNLSTNITASQCTNECPLSDKHLLPLFNESVAIARLVYKLLMEISDETPSVTYAPLLFPLISFLSLYLTEDEIKNVVTALLGDVDMVPSSTNDWNVYCHLLPVLGKRYATKAQRAIRSCNDTDRRQLLFWPYALWSLPLTFLTRVLTCFFIEGNKVLLRAGLLIWKETYRRRGSIRGSHYWRESLKSTAADIGQTYTPQSFLNRMFRIRNFSSLSIVRCKRGLVGALESGEWISPTTNKGYVLFKTKDVNPSIIVTHIELIEIVCNLNPFLSQLNKPVPLFSTATHGYSLRHLYSVTGETAPTLLLIETANGEVVGAFCADPWSMKNRADINRFYGKGECFVFKVRPKPTAFYRWNQDRNSVVANMFQRATKDSLEVGGGSAGAALHIDAELAKGTSSCSSTFDSPCLTENSGPEFVIKSMELLTFAETR